MNRLLPIVACAAFILAGCSSNDEPIVPPDGGRTPKPPTVTPAQWNSTPDPAPPQYNHQPRIVLIHHAGVAWKADDDPIAKVKALQSWGQRDKEWFDVPYHFLIAPDGRIVEGRLIKYKPDTNTTFDTTGFVNVQLWGDLGSQRTSVHQLRSVAMLSAWLADELSMPTDAIVTHRDVAPGQTSCPGADFYRYIEGGQFKQWVDAFRHGEQPHISLLPALDGGPTEVVPGGE